MDSSTILLGILAVALFIVPVYYIQHRQKTQVYKAKQPFLAAAQQQGVSLGQHDFWNEQYGIGLDTTNSRLFYWSSDAHAPQQVVIDLGTVKHIALENMHREVSGNRIIDSIGLRLSLSGAKAQSLYLPFYDKEGNMMLNGELQLAEKWQVLLKSKTEGIPAVQV